MDQSRAWRTYLSVPFNVWVIGVVTFLKNTSSVVLVIFCPVYLSDVLCVTMEKLGILEGLLEATSFFSRIASGVLSDMIRKRKPVLIFGYALSLLGRVFLTLSSSSTGIIFSRAFERLGNGIQGSPRDALVGDFTTAKNRGACFGLRNSLTVSGSIVGALLAMWFMYWSHNNYPMLFLLTLIPSILAIVLLAMFVQDSKLPPREAKKAPFSLYDVVRNLMELPRMFWVLMGLSSLIMLGNVGMVFLVMTAKKLGLSSAYTPIVMILQSLSTFIFAFPLGKLADVWPKRYLLQLGIVVFFFANMGMALTQSLYGVLFCALLWGIQMAAIQNTILAMMTGVIPQRIRGTGFGTLQLSNGVATLLANTFGGLLWHNISYKMTFFSGAVLCFIALILSALWLPKKA